MENSPPPPPTYNGYALTTAASPYIVFPGQLLNQVGAQFSAGNTYPGGNAYTAGNAADQTRFVGGYPNSHSPRPSRPHRSYGNDEATSGNNRSIGNDNGIMQGRSSQGSMGNTMSNGQHVSRDGTRQGQGQPFIPTPSPLPQTPESRSGGHTNQTPSSATRMGWGSVSSSSDESERRAIRTERLQRYQEDTKPWSSSNRRR